MNRLPQWILFDCMETLVDMDPIPTAKDYAAWSYYHSGIETYWQGFDHYLALFVKAGKKLAALKAEHEEWSMLDRLLQICSDTETIDPDQKVGAAARLQLVFFDAYCARCFLKPDVEEVIPQLARNFKLGVVSNFKVPQGIGRILDRLRLLPYFEWVITSAETGWRKPSPVIYQTAIQQAGSSPDRILFVGDDLMNDVITPLALGMNTLLLDRHHRLQAGNEYNCVTNFYELGRILIKPASN